MTENQEKIGVSSFGERVQRYRKRSKLTGEALAKKMNTEYGAGTASRSLIADIENDRRKNIDFDLIIQLAHCIQMSPLALVCDLEQPFMISDNPVFQGRTNASVAGIFLVNFSQPVLEGVMHETSKVLYQTNVYFNNVVVARFEISLFSRFVSGEIDVNDIVDQYPLGPLDLEKSCQESVETVRKQLEYLKTLNVIISDEEENQLSDFDKKIRSYSQQARDKKLITSKNIEDYEEQLFRFSAADQSNEFEEF